MDTKKTNLTPELKEIYDRVMNTSGTPIPTSGTTPSTPPPLPTTPTASGTIPPMPTSSNTINTSLGGITSPLDAPVTPAPQSLNPTMPAMPMMPDPMNQPTPAEQALSNTPARAINEGNSFAFNGTVSTPKDTPAAPNTGAVVEKKKSKISTPILLVLGVVFLLVWGVFWAIIFGFIKR